MLIPVILSGGSGTRLWPVSRESFPKPFMKLGGQFSLLQQTLRRALPLAEMNRVAIVTNHEYAFKSREEVDRLPAAKGRQVTHLLEPMGRNTAPAIAMAALWAIEQSPDATLLILPADHLIPDEKEFQAAALSAAKAATNGAMVLFGIRPTIPETGFGYIEIGEVISADNARKVLRFVEKPNAESALQFLSAGNFVWNSGMFCFRADALLRVMAEHAPDVLHSTTVAWAATPNRDNIDKIAIDSKTFAKCPNISIDYAVMERAHDVLVMPTAFHWSDIGSWKAVAEQLEADSSGNTTLGETMLVDTRNTHIQSEDRLVATIGVDDLLVIDTPDALLVARKSSSQQVKEIVALLKSKGHDAATLHRTVNRPWGTYTVLQDGPRFKIKQIEVRPKQSLSLQMHHHRSEHWIVVSGTARVLCNEQALLVSANESTFIPIGAKHRLENPGMVDLVMIEVQCGDYLGEDDIIRFSDVYGRVVTS